MTTSSKTAFHGIWKGPELLCCNCDSGPTFRPMRELEKDEATLPCDRCRRPVIVDLATAKERRVVNILKDRGVPACIQFIGGYSSGRAETPNGYLLEFSYGAMDYRTWTIWASSAYDSEDHVKSVYLETTSQEKAISHILQAWSQLQKLPKKTEPK